MLPPSPQVLIGQKWAQDFDEIHYAMPLPNYIGTEELGINVSLKHVIVIAGVPDQSLPTNQINNSPWKYSLLFVHDNKKWWISLEPYEFCVQDSNDFPSIPLYLGTGTAFDGWNPTHLNAMLPIDAFLVFDGKGTHVGSYAWSGGGVGPVIPITDNSARFLKLIQAKDNNNIHNPQSSPSVCGLLSGWRTSAFLIRRPISQSYHHDLNFTPTWGSGAYSTIVMRQGFLHIDPRIPILYGHGIVKTPDVVATTVRHCGSNLIGGDCENEEITTYNVATFKCSKVP